MTERTRNIVVGVTTLTGLAGGLCLLLLFGYVPAWLERGYQVRVLLSNASGLTEGSRVRLSGIDIGRVTSVRLRDRAQQGVDVVTLIRRDVRIPQGVQVKAESPLLGGNPSLAFDVEHMSGKPGVKWLPADGTAVIQGESLTLVSQFAGELEAALREPTQQFEKLTQRFARLSHQWNVVGQNLNQMIETRSAQQVDSQEAVANLTTIIARADMRLQELRQVTEGLNRWVNDPQLQQDFVATVANARRLTQRAEGSLHRLEKRYVAVADDLAGLIGVTKMVVDKTRSGQGSVGKLLYDPALYDNFNDALQRLQKAIDESRLLVQKWKAEGLPVQF